MRWSRRRPQPRRYELNSARQTLKVVYEKEELTLSTTTTTRSAAMRSNDPRVGGRCREQFEYMTAVDGGGGERRRRAGRRWTERAKARDGGVRWAQTDDVCERGRLSGGGRWGMLDAHGADSRRDAAAAVFPDRRSTTASLSRPVVFPTIRRPRTAPQLFFIAARTLPLCSPTPHKGPAESARQARLTKCADKLFANCKKPASTPNPERVCCYR